MPKNKLDSMAENIFREYYSLGVPDVTFEYEPLSRLSRWYYWLLIKLRAIPEFPLIMQARKSSIVLEDCPYLPSNVEITWRCRVSRNEIRLPVMPKMSLYLKPQNTPSASTASFSVVNFELPQMWIIKKPTFVEWRANSVQILENMNYNLQDAILEAIKERLYNSWLNN